MKFSLAVKNIKIIINGHINQEKINTIGIKDNNKITYMLDNIKHKLVIEKDSIILTRENDEFKNNLIFNINNSTSTYLLKSNNLEVDINIETKLIKHNENNINIIYRNIDSDENYEFNIEMRKMNEH